MPIENKICRLGEKCRLEQNMPIGTKYADWNDVCLRAYVCVRVCVHVHAHRFQTSEVQKIIVAALPRAHPMERMAKSSAWPMDRAWPKERTPQAPQR